MPVYQELPICLLPVRRSNAALSMSFWLRGHGYTGHADSGAMRRKQRVSGSPAHEERGIGKVS